VSIAKVVTSPCGRPRNIRRTTRRHLFARSKAARLLSPVMMMKTHEFTIVASGLSPEAPDFEDRFFEAGCDDAIISLQKGIIVLEFAREAPNFIKALTSALSDVQRAGAKAERIEPDHLVSMADIARRAGLTRAAISLYAKGMRAQEFPAPVARVTPESPLWDW
jgi:hypothetical protein